MIKLTTDEAYSPYDAWCIYTAISLHFKPGQKYDAIKYNFKGPKCNPAKFEAHKQKYVFEKLVSKYPKKNDFVCYCIANEIAGNSWISDYTHQAYIEWLGRLQRLDYIFSEDIKTLENESDVLGFDECIIPSNHKDVPLIYQLYKSGKITFETLAILENLLQYTRDVTAKIDDPLDVCKDMSEKIVKYAPLIISLMRIDKYTEDIMSSFTF